MKKRLCIFLTIFVVMSMLLGISVCAYSGENTASPYYLYTGSVESSLNIVGGIAYCKSVIKGDNTVTQI